MRSSRVFVVQEVPGRNVLPAERFGRLIPLIDMNVRMHLDTSVSQAMSSLQEKMTEYNDDDYILAIGDPACIGLACAYAAMVNNGRFTVLKWDRDTKQYYSVSIAIPTT